MSMTKEEIKKKIYLLRVVQVKKKDNLEKWERLEYQEGFCVGYIQAIDDVLKHF